MWQHISLLPTCKVCITSCNRWTIPGHQAGQSLTRSPPPTRTHLLHTSTLNDCSLHYIHTPHSSHVRYILIWCYILTSCHTPISCHILTSRLTLTSCLTFTSRYHTLTLHHTLHVRWGCGMMWGWSVRWGCGTLTSPSHHATHTTPSPRTIPWPHSSSHATPSPNASLSRDAAALPHLMPHPTLIWHLLPANTVFGSFTFVNCFS